MQFQDLGLRPELLPTLESMGFTQPTPVQAEAIPIALQNERDLFVIARTGTGKTAAFGLPLLSMITASGVPRALILSPTRELANQISEELRRFSTGLENLKVLSVFGGAPIDRQIAQLRRGTSIVVATPGRLLDLTRRGAIKLEEIKYLVLDEADEMLNMGFKDELDLILEQLPESRRTWLFSATMAKGVKRIAERFMKDSQELRLSPEEDSDGAPQGVIEHIAYNVPRGKKYEALLRLIDATEDLYAMVFCRTRLETQTLGDKLLADGVDAGALHGDLSQALRDQVMNRFKRRELKVLIATDIASRGIDVDELTHVFHYDLPDNAEAYIHRSGRTGRAGHHGQSAIMVEPRDRRRAENLARSVRLHIKLAPIPRAGDVIKRRLREWIRNLSATPIPAELPQWFEELGVEFEQLSSKSSHELLLLTCAQAISSTLHRDRLVDLDDEGREKRDRRERSDVGDRRDRKERRERTPQDDQSSRRNRRDHPERGDRGELSNRRERAQRRDPRDREIQGDRGGAREAVEQSGGMNRVARPVPTKKSAHEKVDHSTRWAVIEVSQGSETGLSEAKLRQTLGQGGLGQSQLGRLQVLDQVSIFEVHERGVDQALKSFKGFKIEGRKVRARRRS